MPKRSTRDTAKRRDEHVSLARHGGRARSRVRVLAAGEVAQRARHELAQITGLNPEHVTSLERSDVDTWNVTVELLELRRIPDTDDLIGSYEAELDETGELLEYRRIGRYSRCQARAAQPEGDHVGDPNRDGEVER